MRSTLALVAFWALSTQLIAANSDSGWLGVNIGNVPPVLAAHLDLEAGRGVVILNLVKGSPADKAGLDRHDVIVAVSGEKLLSGAEEFVATIKKSRPGDEVRLDVIQKGQRREMVIALGKPMVIALGKPSAGGERQYKYDFGELDILNDRFSIRGHVFRKSPFGGWVFKGPGYQLEGNHIEVFPRVDGGSVRVEVKSKDSERRIELRKVEDGETLEVRREGVGPFTVVRKKKAENGDEETTESRYETEEEFKKGDPDAHAFYRSVGKRSRAQAFSFSFPDSDQFRKSLDYYLKKYKAPEFDPEKISEIVRRSISAWEPTTKGFWSAGKEKVERQFKVEDDGRVVVKIRKGESFLETTYASLDELKEKEPRLHEHYEELLK